MVAALKQAVIGRTRRKIRSANSGAYLYLISLVALRFIFTNRHVSLRPPSKPGHFHDLTLWRQLSN